MASCESLTWTIWFSNDKTPTVFDPFVFRLEVDVAGRITGDVFEGLDGTLPLSPVTGQCAPLPRPDGTLMQLQFTWGPVDILLFGFTHLSGVKRFKGRFIALNHIIVNDARFAAPTLTPVIPGDGDTGTGTGQVT